MRPGVTTTCSTTFKSRLLWTFTGLGAIGSLSSSQITSATFSAVGTHSFDCTPREISLHRVADFNSATPWPGGRTTMSRSPNTEATIDVNISGVDITKLKLNP